MPRSSRGATSERRYEHGGAHPRADRGPTRAARQARRRPRRRTQTEPKAQDLLGPHPAPREQDGADQGTGAEQQRYRADGEAGSPGRHQIVNTADQVRRRGEEQGGGGERDDGRQFEQRFGGRDREGHGGDGCQRRGAEGDIGREPRRVHRPRCRAEHQGEERQRGHHRAQASAAPGRAQKGHRASRERDGQTERIPERAELSSRARLGPPHSGLGDTGNPLARLEAQACPRRQGEAISRVDAQRVARGQPPLPDRRAVRTRLRHAEDPARQRGDALALGEDDRGRPGHRASLHHPRGRGGEDPGGFRGQARPGPPRGRACMYRHGRHDRGERERTQHQGGRGHDGHVAQERSGARHGHPDGQGMIVGDAECHAGLRDRKDTPGQGDADGHTPGHRRQRGGLGITEGAHEQGAEGGQHGEEPEERGVRITAHDARREPREQRGARPGTDATEEPQSLLQSSTAAVTTAAAGAIPNAYHQRRLTPARRRLPRSKGAWARARATAKRTTTIAIPARRPPAIDTTRL